MKQSEVTKEELKAMRETMVLTVTDMASKLGLSYSAYHSYESGKSHVPFLVGKYAKELFESFKK